ncbi:hypothetical protein NP233_g261 [Leucocoprinus birnbaumii]|uniref:Uncharacterized protein n=1 Tax=Leucocoprinus birnbaumii TaxID=56174 RepID=A0AAD5W5T3_9AGAR|nr:hypothetical protein NP233_g261 [Leucocoprinus birnbaumii]
MPSAFEFPEYRFGVVFISSTSYGFFIILFALSALVLHRQNQQLIVGLLTVVWGISAIMCFHPAVVNAPDIINYNLIMLLQRVVGNLANTIADTIMVYRLSIIWDQQKMILYISGILLLPCVLGCILWNVIYFSMFGQVNQIPNMILIGISISANVTFTTLIVWKIWERNRLVRALGGEKAILRLLAILIESSALNTYAPPHLNLLSSLIRAYQWLNAHFSNHTFRRHYPFTVLSLWATARSRDLFHAHKSSNVGVLFVANTFYGAFVILFILSTLVLHHQSEQNKRNSTGTFGTRVYLTLGYILCTLITAAWVLSWIMFSHTELVTTPGNRTAINLRSVLLWTQGLAGNIAIFAADVILIYRLYIVWNRSRVMLWLGGIAVMTDVALTIPYITVFAKDRDYWEPGVAAWTALTLGVNVFATALISYKIWMNSRLTRELGDGKIVVRIIAILVESAALQTAWMTIYLILHLANYNASLYLLYSLPEVAGIATALVNVRVGLGWAAGEEGRSVQNFRRSSIDIPEFRNQESFDE